MSTEKCDNEELLNILKSELEKVSIELIYCSDVNYSSEHSSVFRSVEMRLLWKNSRSHITKKFEMKLDSVRKIR